MCVCFLAELCLVHIRSITKNVYVIKNKNKKILVFTGDENTIDDWTYHRNLHNAIHAENYFISFYMYCFRLSHNFCTFCIL